MKWPQSIIDSIVAYMLDAPESVWMFPDLEKQVKAELQRKADEWRQEHGFISLSDYHQKYEISEKEVDTAERLHFLKTPDKKAIPAVFAKYLRDLRLDAPLKPEQLQQVRDETYLSTSKAAFYLGVSTTKFRKLDVAPTVPPWNDKGQYPGKFYRMSDLIQYKGVAESKRAPSVNQRKAWEELNHRQRLYLLSIYHAEKQKERHYQNYPLDWNDPLRKDGEWRWCKHDSDGLTRGLDVILEKVGELDQGTGSTYEALDRRGFIERRHHEIWDPITKQKFTLLDVRLTRKGRALAKAFADFPSMFRKGTP
jgi:DNA-binding transcriptional regulator YiaG